MFAKSQENRRLTTNCNLLYLFVTEFQESNNVIVCHKQSEDYGMSLRNMNIVFNINIVSQAKWGLVAAAIFNVLLAEHFVLYAGGTEYLLEFLTF